MGNLPPGAYEAILRLPVVEADGAQWPSQADLDSAVFGSHPYDLANAVADETLRPAHDLYDRQGSVERLDRLVQNAQALGEDPNARTDPEATRRAARILRFAGALADAFGYEIKSKDGEQ